MFTTSTQYHHWLFSSEEEIYKIREETNQKYIEEHKGKDRINDDQIYDHYLTPKEERVLILKSESILRDFCRKFQPPMPRSVMGTAFVYFKRFYLYNSVIDHQPKFILVSCVYLACKVEEFNVTMEQFVANVKGDRAKASDIILSNELLLMQQLKYHLIIHNTFRPIEGFLIDIKTRYPDIGDPESFRAHIDTFIDKTYFTDASLLFTPSQIALASIIFAATQQNVNLDSYLTDILFIEAPEKLESLRNMMTSLWSMIKRIDNPTKEQVKEMDKKLENCRNQVNNPDNPDYRKELHDVMMEELNE